MGVTAALNYIRGLKTISMGLASIVRCRLVFDSASFLMRMFMGSPGRWEALTLLLLDVLLMAGFEIVVRLHRACVDRLLGISMALPDGGQGPCLSWSTAH